ncbi:MAG: hypothetical protein MI741_22640, partial [Rhodospirillales bacterium]|nr:hypothetical protein [Rhodospirillales bacterium]
LVYPAHDYKGDTVSTIAEEKAHNPRLQVGSVDEYVDIMNGLNLPNPKQMDVAIPANLKIGYSEADETIRAGTLCVADAYACLDGEGHIFVDLREEWERLRDGVIPGSVHAPYQKLEDLIGSDGLLTTMASQTGKEIVLYCAFGERSALALKAMADAGMTRVRHLGGGLKAWVAEGGRVLPPGDC